MTPHNLWTVRRKAEVQPRTDGWFKKKPDMFAIREKKIDWASSQRFFCDFRRESLSDGAVSVWWSLCDDYHWVWRWNSNLCLPWLLNCYFTCEYATYLLSNMLKCNLYVRIGAFTLTRSWYCMLSRLGTTATVHLDNLFPKLITNKSNRTLHWSVNGSPIESLTFAADIYLYSHFNLSQFHTLTP